MRGRRGKADPGRHHVRAAPEAVENRFRVRQEQKLGRFPKWNVSCTCRMPGASRTPVKVRRRAASRNLLRFVLLSAEVVWGSLIIVVVA